MSSRRLAVSLSLRARKDYAGILAYGTEEWGERRALAYGAEIDRALTSLGEFPEMGRARDDLRPGYRSLAVEHHVIVYRADEHAVEIVRIVHEKADIGRRLGDR